MGWLKTLAPPVAAAIIALLGVLVSAVVSWLISRRTLLGQLRSVRIQIQQAQIVALQPKRIEAYRDLHEIVRRFVKAVQRRDASYQLLADVAERVSQWDAQYSLFLGGQATGTVYRYERYLRSLVQKGEHAFSERVANRKQRLELIRRSFSVEISLKNDLGIYQIEFAKPGRRFTTYEEISAETDSFEDNG